MLVTRACDKVTVASQAHFLSYDSAALIFAQESKALHTDLEERSKAEAASEKSYTQKCKDLKWTLFVLFHIFFRGLFKLSISCLTGLCIRSQAQANRRGTLAKIHCIGKSSSCSGTVTVLHLSHVCMYVM